MTIKFLTLFKSLFEIISITLLYSFFPVDQINNISFLYLTKLSTSSIAALFNRCAPKEPPIHKTTYFSLIPKLFLILSLLSCSNPFLIGFPTCKSLSFFLKYFSLSEKLSNILSALLCKVRIALPGITFDSCNITGIPNFFAAITTGTVA